MSSLDMSLDDLAKQHRSSGSSRGGRGGSRGGSSSSSTRGGSSQNGSGPIRNKQRHSGGAAAPRQQQQQPYARVSTPLQYAAPLAYTSAAPAGGKWQRDLYQSPEPQQIQQPAKKLSGDTIHVSNLASDVSDDDVREIFERIGAVKSCTVNYNRDGKSTGTATVTFARKSDAEKAVEDYDDAEVDGRPMKLKLVGSVVSAPVVVKKQKPQVVQQQHQVAAPQLAFLPQQIFQQQPLQYAQSYQQQPRQSKPAAPRGGAGAARGGRGGRDGAPSAPSSSRGGAQSGRGGRGGKAAPAQKKEVSGADLDAELDSYHKQREAAAAPAAAAPEAGQPTTV